MTTPIDACIHVCRELTVFTCLLALFFAPFGNLYFFSVQISHVMIVLSIFFFSLVQGGCFLTGVRADLLVLAPLKPMWFFILSALVSLVYAIMMHDYPPPLEFSSFSFLFKPLLVVFLFCFLVVPTVLSDAVNFRRAWCLMVSSLIIALMLGVFGFFQTHIIVRDYAFTASRFWQFQSIPFEMGDFSPIFPNRNNLAEILLPGLAFFFLYSYIRYTLLFRLLMLLSVFVLLGTSSKTVFLLAVLMAIYVVFLLTRSRFRGPSTRDRRALIVEVDNTKVKRGIGVVLFVFILSVPFFFLVPRLFPDFQHHIHGPASPSTRHHEEIYDIAPLAVREADTVDAQASGSYFEQRVRDIRARREGISTEGKKIGRSAEEHFLAFWNRFIQYRFAVSFLFDRDEIVTALCGNGPRSFQFLFNSYTPFANQFGKKFNYFQQLDAHGVLVKAGTEQGWFGIITFSVLMITLFMAAYNGVFASHTKLNLNQLIVANVGICVILVYMLIGTSYYQPVLWVPLTVLFISLEKGLPPAIAT